jgi:FkbM family methyltransferase
MVGLVAYWEDERELREMFWHPQQDDVVFDIGCAEGSYTLPALKAGAFVYAVDPSAERLGTLVEWAGVGAKLKTINKAFFDGGPYPDGLMNDLRDEPDFAPTPNWSYSTLDLQASEHHLQRLDWVKVDVEGAEAGVLDGGLETLRAFHPQILIEDHTGIYPWVESIHSSDRIGAFLDRLGYVWKMVPYFGPGTGRSYFVCS